MKRLHTMIKALSMMLGLAAGAAAWASEAQTSAQASNGRRSAGEATATARYSGDIGFARTDTRSGRVSLARGVAVGVDEKGLSVSISTAVAPRVGPALATNFSMSIGADGQVSHSQGLASARGGRERSVSAGGTTVASPISPASTSVGAAHTRGGGVARVAARSESAPRVLPLQSRPASRGVAVIRR